MKLNPDDFVVRLAQGEKLSEAARAALDQPDVLGVHYWEMKCPKETELHFHDFDEYWLFTEGRTRLTLRTEEGVSKTFDIEPYTLVATPKGMEHGHVMQSDGAVLEWQGERKPGARDGHLTREF
jgi:mannose-6-phosphate isomerase-like protein (cupin superfamily)